MIWTSRSERQSMNTYQGNAKAPTALSPSYPSYPSTQLPLQGALRDGRKKALLIGVRYRKKNYELKGTINDVNCMKYFLVKNLHFPSNSILTLTEDEKDPSRSPTKQNILSAMQWLIDGCRSGDSLMFHYSGHGSQQADYTEYKKDGYDKTICPLDHETKGMILDDVINEIIVRPLPKGVILHAVIDSSHNNTILELPFLCKFSKDGHFQWVEEAPPVNKGTTSGGLALCISACADHQSSIETSVL